MNLVAAFFCLLLRANFAHDPTSGVDLDGHLESEIGRVTEGLNQHFHDIVISVIVVIEKNDLP